MTSLFLDPRKTALVIIDLQNGVLSQPTFPYSTAEVVQNSNLLAKRFRKKGATVVYVRVDMADFLRLPVDVPSRPPGSAPLPASASELAPQVGFEAGDLLITKRHWGAFAGTELERELRQRDIETIVLTGISTNIGVESTARQGTGLGFAFIIVEDACSARDANDHHFAFEKIFPRLAQVKKTSEVLEAFAS